MGSDFDLWDHPEAGQVLFDEVADRGDLFYVTAKDNRTSTNQTREP